MIEGKSLPRKPVDPDEDDAFYLGGFLRNFVIVNGLVFIGALATPVFRPTMGSTASSHTDPRTRQPVLMELQGGRLVGDASPAAPGPEKKP